MIVYLLILLELSSCVFGQGRQWTTEDGLVIRKMKVKGCKDKAEDNNYVYLELTAKKQDGTLLYQTPSSIPVEFTLGKGKANKALDIGVKGMCVGDVRELEVIPELMKGDTHFMEMLGEHDGAEPTMMEIKLIKKELHENKFRSLDLNKDGLIDKDEIRMHIKEYDPEIDDENIENDIMLILTENDRDDDGALSDWEYYREPAPPKKDEL